MLRLEEALAHFFCGPLALDRGETVVVAFSGGPDSTALVAALARLQPVRAFRIVAAHLDHGLDPGSADRAATARRIALGLGVAFTSERRAVGPERRVGESSEAAARRVRYRYLWEICLRRGARFVVTAHHRDDQVETVLLRLLQGSGWEGLAGIRPVLPFDSRNPRSVRIVRPFLGLSRSTLEQALRILDDVVPTADPTNRDLSLARNRVRHLLRPRLEDGCPGLGERLAALAGCTSRLRQRVTAQVASHLGMEVTSRGVAVSRSALRQLPSELLAPALAELHRRVGAPYPAGRAAREELTRQLALDDGPCDSDRGCPARESRDESKAEPTDAGERVRRGCGVDCGRGFRWEAKGELLELLSPVRPTPRTPRFAYTLKIPGDLIIEELGIGFRVTRGSLAPWMLRGAPRRAGLHLPLADGARVVIRNRRPGDRLQPLGAGGGRRLKEILIDRRVPRSRRDRLPLLIVDGRIAWVPGVTVEHRFRLREGDRGSIWVAEIFRIQTVSDRGLVSESTGEANRFEE